jgi:hypothetical protein
MSKGYVGCGAGCSNWCGIAGTVLGEAVLFWVARQGGGRLGSALGVLFPILAIFAAIYLMMSHH